MAAIDNNKDFPLGGLVAAATTSAVRSELNALLWGWYDNNKDRSIKFNIGFIPVSIKIGKLSPLFVMIAGSHP